MPGIRRRFGSARGIGSRSAAPRGALRGTTSVRKFSISRTGSTRLPKVGFHAPQVGLPRIPIGPFITVRPRMHFVQFDRSIIKTNWNKINRNPLQNAANWIRILARSSIKRRKSRNPSPAGTPPYSHWPGTSPPFKQIYNYPMNFGAGQIIGMVGYGGQGFGEPPVPSLNEYGGRARRNVFNQRRLIVPQPRNPLGQFVQHQEPKFIPRTVRYRPRPFMRPALMKAAPTINQFWRNSIRGNVAYVGRGARVSRRRR